jgi:Fe-S cluster assembly protein SufD
VSAVAVDANKHVEEPIRLQFTDSVENSTSITVGANGSVVVIEEYTGSNSAYSTSAKTQISLAPGARLYHYKIQRQGPNAEHLHRVDVHQEKDSSYHSFSFADGAIKSRVAINTVLDGVGAHVTLNGLYMADAKQYVEHDTRIEHVKENCTSHELYKGILDGHSHGVFSGKVYVHPEAQKTDGKQSNNNLLLSDHARIDTNPQLEIFADDVKCTHGATVGKLDQTALFYFKSRGISDEKARSLLTYAFAADVLEQIELESLRNQLEELVLKRFTKRFTGTLTSVS